ncbi:MAG TPA: GNAT family N-acetyltransferase [Actinomycetota bacterium]|nr:GNAT family N-acetyltransferase [Actinomycetota bacterium]
MSSSTIVVTPATAADLGAISRIYDHYVERSPATFDVKPKTLAWRREWFSTFAERGRYRLLVARGDGGLLGYASSSPHRPKAAYEPTVETTLYVAPGHTGRGIGLALYRSLLTELETEDVHRACAGITLPNPGSVRLHERCGFRLVGTFTEQGRKFDRYWDVAWYERPFPSS